MLGVARDSNRGRRAVFSTEAESEVGFATIDDPGFEEGEDGSELFSRWHRIQFSSKDKLVDHKRI